MLLDDFASRVNGKRSRFGFGGSVRFASEGVPARLEISRGQTHVEFEAPELACDCMFQVMGAMLKNPSTGEMVEASSMLESWRGEAKEYVAVGNDAFDKAFLIIALTEANYEVRDFFDPRLQRAMLDCKQWVNSSFGDCWWGGNIGTPLTLFLDHKITWRI